jgi:3-oxoacyl-[acyl-carrier-protein] synthase II
MRQVFASGAARIDPAPAQLKPERWASKPARLARMDRLCALALCAADAALLDAGLDAQAIAGWDAARAGAVVGSAFGCHATNEEYYRGLLAEGVRGASPRLFAYTLPSSPVGEISIHYRLRGPADTVASGRHAGLEALEAAMRLCATGRADRVLCVAAEVGSPTLARLGLRARDAAAAILLEHRPGRRSVRIAGAARGFGDGALDQARARALEEADLASAPALAYEAGDGAVDPLSALAGWILDGAPEGSACVSAADREGGAAAIAAAAP